MSQFRISFIFLTIFYFSIFSKAQEATSIISSSTDVLNPLGNWGLSYFNFSNANLGIANTGSASWNIYQYLAWNYKFDQTQRLSLRAAFNTSTPGPYDSRGNVNSLSTKSGDAHIVYSNYSLGEYPGEWDLTGAFYAYLPTSESSLNKKWVTRLKGRFELSKKMTKKWLLTLSTEPEYYLNTQKSYRKVTQNTAADGRIYSKVYANENQKAELNSGVQASYNLNKTFIPQVKLSYNQMWNEDSDQVNWNGYSDSINLELSSWVEVSRTLRFIVGYSNQIGLTNRSFPKEVRYFHPDESQIQVLTFWNLY